MQHPSHRKSIKKTLERNFMKWSTPSYQDLRFGFEINLYINNR